MFRSSLLNAPVFAFDAENGKSKLSLNQMEVYLEETSSMLDKLMESGWLDDTYSLRAILVNDIYLMFSSSVHVCLILIRLCVAESLI